MLKFGRLSATNKGNGMVMFTGKLPETHEKDTYTNVCQGHFRVYVFVCCFYVLCIHTYIKILIPRKGRQSLLSK